MSEIRSGVRGLLRLPLVYRLFNCFIGSDAGRFQIVHTYIRPSQGDRILDIGCGPADILTFLPSVEYVGFDANPRYVREAQQRYGNRGSFFCQMVDQVNLPKSYENYFDIVLGLGILYHLDNSLSFR